MDTAEDYLVGRVRYPSWLKSLQQKPYTFNDDASLTNGATKLFQLQIQADSYFMVESIDIIPSTIGAYESLTVQISDTTTTQNWSSAPVNLRDIAGRGDNSKKILPNLLRPSSVLNVSVVNSQGSTQQVYVSISGRKIYNPTSDQVAFLTRRMWYQYVLPLPAIAAGITSQIGTVQIFNESDFLCHQLFGTTIHQFVVNTASAGAASSEIMMQLRDLTSDNSFFAKKLAARTALGTMWTPYKSGGASFTNGRGFKLQRPLLIRRNGIVQGDFDNLSATNLAINTGYVVLEGVRIFDAK